MTEFVLDNFLPYQLTVLASRASREFSAIYREKYGLSVPEWRVVAHLSQTEHPVSVREIHLRVDMDKSKVSRAASRLQERGYVIKDESPNDRRLIALRLSKTGQDMVSVLAPIARKFENDYLKQLGPDSEQFRDAITKLLTKNEP